MKKFILTLAVLAATICASAEEKTKTYDFGDIKILNVEYNYQVYVTKGNSGKVKIEYDSKFEDYLKVKYYADGKSLSISMDDRLPNMLKTGKQPRINVYLEMNEITKVDLSGACTVTFEGEYKAGELDIEVSGASKLNYLKIDGRNLDADCSGAAFCKISGNFTEDVELDLSGASKMEYAGNSKVFEAEISGASKLSFSGKYDNTEVTCSGASKANMEGSSESAEYECSGASNIEAEDFIVKNVKASLSGASRAEIHATDNLTYMVSRSSKIVYYGDAVLKNVSTDTNVVKGR